MPDLDRNRGVATFDRNCESAECTLIECKSRNEYIRNPTPPDRKRQKPYCGVNLKSPATAAHCPKPTSTAIARIAQLSSGIAEKCGMHT